MPFFIKSGTLHGLFLSIQAQPSGNRACHIVDDTAADTTLNSTAGRGRTDRVRVNISP